MFSRFLAIEGLKNHFNDIILTKTHSGLPKGLTIFFHGDIQDYSENMKDSKYLRWNLEHTAQIMASKFLDDCVMLIRASRRKNYGFLKVFYDNFVKSDFHGEGIFNQTIDSLVHLKTLVERANNLCPELKLSRVSHIKLVGFSQGMTAVNQLIYSLSIVNTINDICLVEFASLIKNIYWLDGGKCWITDRLILQVIRQRVIKCHIAVTPFQVMNPERPKNRENILIFKKILRDLNVDFNFRLYYEGKEPNVELHFQLLNDFVLPT